MEPHERTVVVPAESEFVQVEQQLEKEIVQIEDKLVHSDAVAWVRELSSFATALLVTTAGVLMAGALAVVLSVAFVASAPILLLGLTVATARSIHHRRLLAQ
jgi:hypothetical protein